jgi:uncharacterized glyoxalase superfamily protein PhnB
VIPNRSVPRSTVIPELAYRDFAEASARLCDAFGFRVRRRVGDHRVQLVYGDGAVIVIAREAHEDQPYADDTHAVLVRVADAARHHDHAKSRGARILRPPADYPYGERQYAVELG